MKPEAVARGCAAALLLLGGCTGRSARSAEPAAAGSRVVVVAPVRADVAREITLPGDLVGKYQAALYAKVSGYLSHIDVDKGDWVKQGQLLAEIEVPELEQKLRRARASLQVQRITYERLKGVRDSDPRLVAQQDVDVTEGKFEQAKAEVEELEAMIGYTRIVAPFDGVITARHVDPGALIRATGQAGGEGGGQGGGGPLLEIAAVRELRVYVYVPEQEVALVRRGAAARLTLREFPGRTFEGKVARFATALDLATRTMLAEVDLDNPKGELYPGMYADVSLELERHPGVWTLPTTAIARSETGSYVLVARDGKLHRQPVATGITQGGETEIRSGLSGSEDVVRNIGPGLTDGEAVEAVRAAAATA